MQGLIFPCFFLFSVSKIALKVMDEFLLSFFVTICEFDICYQTSNTQSLGMICFFVVKKIFVNTNHTPKTSYKKQTQHKLRFSHS